MKEKARRFVVVGERGEGGFLVVAESSLCDFPLRERERESERGEELWWFGLAGASLVVVARK